MTFRFIRLTSPLICLSFAVLGCSFEGESEEQTLVTYARNVESCVCRGLAFDADNIPFRDVAEINETCNEFVRQSNAMRYEGVEPISYSLDQLRCPEDVEEWQEALAEHRTLEASSRDSYQQFLSSENNDPDETDK